MLNSKDIRQQFIEFFLSKGHHFVPSAPVVPVDDNTLLFTNAGMNQFKGIFLGLKEPEFPRAVNSQKCIRAGGKHNDLEEVGKDGYHHTFFEMLGNWSFGDYYKKEAITWAWELLTEVWKLPKELLHATVHESDNEAYNLWKELTDIDPSHISYHGDKDNFWEMGETGPCGPCSELNLDRGLAFCDKQHDPNHKCLVNGDCQRYIELWNLVFIQYFRDESGRLQALKSKYVDTGAGLERICQVLQGKKSNYETDLFVPLLDKIAELSGTPYSEEGGLSHRVIADHIRTLCFALADGGFPSNEGRGYVLRRILRRAARHGRLLGFKEPFMWLLVDTFIEVMGGHYLELTGKSAYIQMVIKAEEDRFNQTLDKGLEIFEEIVSNLENRQISGADAFMLYDTYGFPLDLTELLATERDIAIDLKGFEQQMKAQKDRARKAAKFNLDLDNQEWTELHPSQATQYVGYEHYSCEARILRYILGEDGNISIQLDKTPFYAESGGQTSDTGVIRGEGLEVEIHEVKKIEDHFVHIGMIQRGHISSDIVYAEIDILRRNSIAKNHSATHLLHKALRDVLGDHVQQKGSLVSPDYLRFDFTHFQALTPEQLRQVEIEVNQQIRLNRSVLVSESTLDEARSEGVIALFGEKYADKVRVVNIDGYSKELCGGIHVHSSGEIGLFKISSESSSAAGIRRIEAITGKAVEDYIYELEEFKSGLGKLLNCSLKQIPAKLETLQHNLIEAEKELYQLRQKELQSGISRYIETAASHGDVKLINTIVKVSGAEDLRLLGDQLREKTDSTISILYNVNDDKVSILCVLSKNLSQTYHAGKIVGKIAELFGGKGGGRPESAMAGAKVPSDLEALIRQVPQLIFA